MRWNKLCVICCLAADLLSQTVSTLTRETRNPYGLVIGPDKALYICEIDRHVVSRLDLKTKRLTIVAGTPGKNGYAGDGGPATQALLFEPYEVRFDAALPLTVFPMPPTIETSAASIEMLKLKAVAGSMK